MSTHYGWPKNYYYELDAWDCGWLEAWHDYDAYRKVKKIAKGRLITYLAQEYNFDSFNRRAINISLIEQGRW